MKNRKNNNRVRRQETENQPERKKKSRIHRRDKTKSLDD